MNGIPAESVNRMLVEVSRQIHDHGWALVGLPLEGALFHFTLGIKERFDHPDLETLGLDEGLARDFLGALVARIKSGERFRSGDFFTDLAGGYDLFLVNNPVSLNGPPLTGSRLRLVWPDANHRYPWHADCEEDCAMQRFLPTSEGLNIKDLQLLLTYSQKLA